MKTMFLLVCIFAVSAAAQSDSAQTSTNHSKKAKDEVTVQGCVSKLSTDYVLVQADLGNTYELQATGKLHLRHYLGQQVEVTGAKVSTMGTSSDFIARTGVASPVTIIVDSIKTVQKKCSNE
jgi:hypothetical protein